MAKCLVTGGAGFIGSNLVDALIERGDEVVIIDDLSTGKREYVNERAKFYEVDINSDQVADIFNNEKIDCVFHLAAQIDVRKSVTDPMFDNYVNAQGSFNIFKKAAEAGVKKVIFVTTGGALYGDCIAPATEENLVRPNAPYGIHKYAAEGYLEVFRETHGLKSCILRLANVYGPRQYKGGECGVVGIFTFNHANKEKSYLFGDGSKTRDYVFVDDVVRAIVSVFDNAIEGVYNIGTGRETSILEIIAAIKKTTGEEFDYEQKDDRPGEVQRSVLSYAKAKRDMSWEPQVDLEAGIKKTFDWLNKKV